MSIPIIAHLLNQPVTSWTVKIAAGCDYLGLLRSRVIRSWFGITQDRLNRVQEEFRSHTTIRVGNQISINKTDWDANCQRWGITSRTNQAAQSRAPFASSDTPHNPALYRPLLAAPREVSAVKVPDGFIRVANQNYRIVDTECHNFAEPLAVKNPTAGSEITLLDPKSPVLERYYRDFERKITNHARRVSVDPQTIALLIPEWMSTLFPCLPSEKDLSPHIEKYKLDTGITKYEGTPCISIDRFLEHKETVSRHRALLAAYFIERYCREHPRAFTYPFIVQLSRHGAEGEVPVWLVTMIPKSIENGKGLCIDCTSELVWDFNLEYCHHTFDERFGKDAARIQINRGIDLRRTVAEKEALRPRDL